MSQYIYEKLLKNIEKGEIFNRLTCLDEKQGRIKDIKEYILSKNSKEFVLIPKIILKDGKVCFYEPIAKKERLIILGGGHIALFLCEFAATVGFETVVVDDRKEFAYEERFPYASKVICASFEKALEILGINQNDYVTIITRGHKYDGDCLFYIVNHEMPFYLGMIGSRTRVAAQFAMFSSKGVDSEKLEKVCTPIGLAIKAVTPEEIAISILAELIQHKRSQNAASVMETDLDIDVIEKIVKCDQPAAVVTVMHTDGSTPRGAGAKMLVTENGKMLGTIGGGLGEMEAIEKARKLIGTGRYLAYHFTMNADVAAADGMACGGNMDVLIEDLLWR